jgi:LemA protein
MKKITVMLVALFLLSGCGYNQFQSYDEEIKSSWAEMLSQCQRRNDLIPNTVAIVERYAQHESGTFKGIAEARSKASSIQVDAKSLKDSAQVQQFLNSQGELSMALGKLMSVQENYPQLKADAQFIALQSQLEGTENRIAVARNRFIRNIKDYNKLVRSFPTNLTAKMFDFEVKDQYTTSTAVLEAPKIKF